MWYFAGGDSGFYFIEQLQKISWVPISWHSEYELGTSLIARLWFDYPFLFIIKFLSTIGFTWWLIDKLMWSLPVVIGLYSSWKLAHAFLPSKWQSAIASIIYCFNTYALMVFGGGQLGVLLGYALTPLVLLEFIQFIDTVFKKENKSFSYNLLRSVSNGLWLCILIAFDLRLAYLTLLGISVYFLFLAKDLKKYFLHHISWVILSVVIAGLTHMFWILPLMKSGIGSLGNEYTGVGMLHFLSVADFSHALALLHPNWPENIFGKVYFLQPEFLILPILAYISLCLYSEKEADAFSKQDISAKQNNVLLYFSLLGLIGAFLAKGTQEPLGGVFEWMFHHVPGFVMFRDPTKWYMLVALSYCLLIPFTLKKISNLIDHVIYRKKIPSNISKGMLISVFIFLTFWGYAHRQAVQGKLGGLFHLQRLPDDYRKLKDYLVKNPEFSRVLWVPSRQRYGFYSEDKPALSIEAMGFASPSAFIAWIQKPNAEEQLRRYNVSDIIVPIDSLGELFITNHHYDDLLRVGVINELRSIPWLEQDHTFTHISLFRLKTYYTHAYLIDSPDTRLVVDHIDSTKYTMLLPKGLSGKSFVFSEAYDPNWRAIYNGTLIPPQKTSDGLQQYMIPINAVGTLTLEYLPQRLVMYGSAVSLATFAGAIVYIVTLYKKNH